MQPILGIKHRSIASKLQIQPGDKLISINGQAVIDVVDYEYLTANAKLELLFLTSDGEEYEAVVEKHESEPLGLEFGEGLMSPVRSCKNHCVFCFIDQMPHNSRDTLHFKDDDWRLSLIMGNYVSLTNVDEAEFDRILSRRISPLYISVHATEPGVRVSMMRNPRAGDLFGRLTRLRGAGLRFHCQIVCCPGINDGDVLMNTLKDLSALYPAAQSVAVVPVGLTKYRDGLYPLRVFAKDEAERTIRAIEAFADECRRESGSAFVYASDEFYLLAEIQLPPYEAYGDFPQIENGVGLLRLFEFDFICALEEYAPLKLPFAIDVAGGMLAYPFFQELYGRLRPYKIEYTLHPIRNDFFGHTVTVGGLVTGRDILAQLKGKLSSSVLLLPHQMLREREDVFLDGMTVSELQEALGARIVIVRGDGEEWVNTIFHESQTEV